MCFAGQYFLCYQCFLYFSVINAARFIQNEVTESEESEVIAAVAISIMVILVVGLIIIDSVTVIKQLKQMAENIQDGIYRIKHLGPVKV